MKKYQMTKLKTILKGVRMSNGRTYMWVLDKATDKMIKVNYTDLGIDFFSKNNTN